MRRLWAGVLALSLGGLALAWDDPPEGKKDPPTRAEKVKAVQDDYTKAVRGLNEELQKAETAKEKNEVRAKLPKLRTEAAEKALEIAKEDPKDDAGFDAIKLALTMGSGAAAKHANELLLTHHVANPKIADMVLGLGRGGSDDAVKFLRAVLDKNPDKTAKGRALYALVGVTADKIEKAKSDDEAKKFEDEALGYIKRIESEFADVTQVTLPPTSKAEPRLLGKMAAKDAKGIVNIKNLKVGKAAPEIENEDTDGAKFKLSDYRGKVVLLDFWGHW